MGIIIGIDVGISTTKIIGIKDGEVVSPIRITAIDPVTSLYGAFGKYLHDTGISLTDIEHIMLTGVGSAYIDKPVYGLPTTKVEEFLADGLGARHESGIKDAIVVSMGTGTSFVKCVGNDICHIGGIGAGGGTLQGLSRGLIYMVLQSIGSAAVLAAIGSSIKDFVLIGNLTLLPACKDIFPAIGNLYGVRFHIPQHSEFCTAIGAGLNYFNK